MRPAALMSGPAGARSVYEHVELIVRIVEQVDVARPLWLVKLERRDGEELDPVATRDRLYARHKRLFALRRRFGNDRQAAHACLASFGFLEARKIRPGEGGRPGHMGNTGPCEASAKQGNGAGGPLTGRRARL